MTPYYEQNGITIYHADCRDVLPTIEADVLVVDPPYGVELGIDKDMRGGQHGLAKEAYASYQDTYDNFVSVIVPALGSYVKLCKRGAIFSGPYFQELPRTQTLGGIYFPAGKGRHNWGFKVFLPILFYGNAPALQLGAKHNVLKSSEPAEQNGHPCPKPLGWMTWLVSITSLEGETIVDPFMGSGTTLRAAKDLGRRAIGIEIEERYCEIAARRLSQEVLAL